MQLAHAADSAGDIATSVGAARTAARLSPQDPDALELAGHFALLQERPLQAEALLRQAHVLRPQDEPILIELVKSEIAATDMTGAQKDLTLYLRVHPSDLQGCYWMAYLDQHQAGTPGKLQAALAYAQRASVDAPQDPAVNALLGQLELQAEKPALALRCFRTALRSDPSQQDALAGVQICLQRLGQGDQAVPVAAALQRVTARRNAISQLDMQMQANPRNIAVGLQLARLEEQDGQIRLAQSYYEQMIRFSPHDPRPHAAFASFLERMGRPDLARQAANLNFVP